MAENQSKTHEHKPDWSTMRPADDVPSSVDFFVDVWCPCGASGTVRIGLLDIQWGDDEEKEEG